MDIKNSILSTPNDVKEISLLEKEIEQGDYKKLSFQEFEKINNLLFSTNKSQVIKLINSYFSKLVGLLSTKFFHLRVEENGVDAYCKDMIQNYKYIFMYNRYIDCSELLYKWSPTESYFPLLEYIHKSQPDAPIDYVYWLKRFRDLPVALKFLKEHNIKIEFSDKEDLIDLYKAIPTKYIEDFISLLGDKSWYMDIIKEVDEFLE